MAGIVISGEQYMLRVSVAVVNCVEVASWIPRHICGDDLIRC